LLTFIPGCGDSSVCVRLSMSFLPLNLHLMPRRLYSILAKCGSLYEAAGSYARPASGACAQT
jgi:hypothetical protein